MSVSPPRQSDVGHVCSSEAQEDHRGKELSWESHRHIHLYPPLKRNFVRIQRVQRANQGSITNVD